MIFIGAYFLGVWAVISLILGIGFKLGLWSLAMSAGAVLMFLAASLQEILASPPEIGILTIFGKRLNFVFREGWKIIPWPFGLIRLAYSRINKDYLVPIQTPDGASMEIEIALTFRVDVNNSNEFLNSGGLEGVDKILEDIVEQETVRWARHPEEGPQTWKEVFSMGPDLVQRLLCRILSGTGCALDPDDLAKVLAGNGNVPIGLGVVLNRINIGRPQLSEETRKAADKVAQEHIERESEEYELATDIELAQKMVEGSKGGMRFDWALKEVRQMRAIREGKGQIIYGAGFEAFRGIGPAIGTALASLLGEKGKPKKPGAGEKPAPGKK